MFLPVRQGEGNVKRLTNCILLISYIPIVGRGHDPAVNVTMIAIFGFMVKSMIFTRIISVLMCRVFGGGMPSALQYSV